MYPVWEFPGLTAGIVLALIATFHMLPSHLSTSAMWFNVFIERKAYKEDRPELLEFVRKYSLFILIFSYVFGSLSGIGIWYAATVASPRAISGLIHSYVWGWATEWVFFIVEIAGIFVYYYTLGKVDKKTHLKIGWIFAIASWTTMVVITGILAFMATPGKWPVTGGFFDGFFNQTYWPQLLMRSTLMFVIAAAYAIAVATRLKNAGGRATIIKTAARWGMAGVVLGAIFLLWYLRALPAGSADIISTIVTGTMKVTIAIVCAVLLLYFLFAATKPSATRTTVAVVAIFVVFCGIWMAERTRESVRKPYLIPQYMYSNQIIGKDLPAKKVISQAAVLNEKGILVSLPFVPNNMREISDGNSLEVGRLIARVECVSCHTLSKWGLRPMDRMVKRAGLTDAEKAATLLDGLDGYPYMPPFFGTQAEKKALAAYLVSLGK
jgi:hypothetical protein